MAKVDRNAFLSCNDDTEVVISGFVFKEPDFILKEGVFAVATDNSYTTTVGQFDGKTAGVVQLTSVAIPDAVLAIGDRAFKNQSSLTDVFIPDSVTSIGREAFYGCENLQSLTVPDSVTEIGRNAFGNCGRLILSVGYGSGGDAYCRENKCTFRYQASEEELAWLRD